MKRGAIIATETRPINKDLRNITPEEWERSHCHQTPDPDAWYETWANSSDDDFYRTMYALAMCETCPLKNPCLQLALQHPEDQTQGIWGGTLPGERLALLGLNRYRRETQAIHSAKVLRARIAQYEATREWNENK